MKAYSISEIIKDVRTAIDQNRTAESLVSFGDTETLSLDDIIASKIAESVKTTHCAAPVFMLDGGEDFANEIYWDEQESGHIMLPDDFMRLIVFKMDDWEKAVYNAITPDLPEYVKQTSRFKGVRGNRQRPVCAITFRPEGKALEFYSCGSEDARIAKALYLPYPSIDSDNDTIKICERCYKSVIYAIAALVSLTFNDNERYKAFSELSKSSLI